MLRATGHGDAGGAWLPIGVGVHTGVAYFGSVSGADGTVPDWTALGDNVNIAARLAQEAGPGEALISDAAYAAAGLDPRPLEQRHLDRQRTRRVVRERKTDGGTYSTNRPRDFISTT